MRFRRVLLAFLLGATLVACGSPDEESRVRDVLATLADATAHRDYRKLCDDVLAPTLVRDVEDTGVPCADALRAGLGDVRSPRLAVRSVTVKGKRAFATVHTEAKGQRPSDDTVELAKLDAGWRVVSLSGQSAASTR